MKLFNTLLEIKTAQKGLPLKAIFIEKSSDAGVGTYFIYYYDVLNHTFYINDLNYI